jgi:thioredoxin 1
MAIAITNANFEVEVLKSDIPVVIDFYAPWGGPCKQMLTIIEELAKEFANFYKVVKINIDEERDLAVKYNVSSIPTFVFIKNGELVAKETGSMGKDSFKNKIESYLGV